MPRLSYFRKLAGRPAGNPMWLAPSSHPFRRGEGRVSEPGPQFRPPVPPETAKGPQITAPRATEANPNSRPQPVAPPRAHVLPESGAAEALARPPETPALISEIAKEPGPHSPETNPLREEVSPARTQRSESGDHPQSIETRTITVHEERPEPAPRPAAVAATQSHIEIGSIEIEIVAPPAVPAPKPAAPAARRPSTAIRRSAPAPLARGFGSMAGLRQG